MDTTTHIMGLKDQANDIMSVEHLTQCLTYSKSLLFQLMPGAKH